MIGPYSLRPADDGTAGRRRENPARLDPADAGSSPPGGRAARAPGPGSLHRGGGTVQRPVLYSPSQRRSDRRRWATGSPPGECPGPGPAAGGARHPARRRSTVPSSVPGGPLYRAQRTEFNGGGTETPPLNS
eukprot:292792-Hanusia_phi.AAC.1